MILASLLLFLVDLNLEGLGLGWKTGTCLAVVKVNYLLRRSVDDRLNRRGVVMDLSREWKTFWSRGDAM